MVNIEDQDCNGMIKATGERLSRLIFCHSSKRKKKHKSINDQSVCQAWDFLNSRSSNEDYQQLDPPTGWSTDSPNIHIGIREWRLATVEQTERGMGG